MKEGGNGTNVKESAIYPGSECKQFPRQLCNWHGWRRRSQVSWACVGKRYLLLSASRARVCVTESKWEV